MAVWTIAGLTLKEAVRRRTLVGALLLGLLVLGLSFLFSVIRYRMQLSVANGRMSEMAYTWRLPYAQSAIIMLCLSSIKMLSALFAIMMAGGSVSGEIERGLLAVILPKPVPRWQILLGKWIGMNVILMSSAFVWALLVWISLTWQTGKNLTPMLTAGAYLTLFPLTVGTLTLTFSTFSQRVLGTSLAIACCCVSWFDGILNSLGKSFDVEILFTFANIAGMVVPQGYIGWWIEEAMKGVVDRPPGGGQLGISPRFLTEWGGSQLNFAHLDAAYLVFYVALIFVVGAVIFHKRDV